MTSDAFPAGKEKNERKNETQSATHFKVQAYYSKKICHALQCSCSNIQQVNSQHAIREKERGKESHDK